MSEDRPKWHDKLSPQGREALEQGFNPRSMSDEDYEVWSKHHKRALSVEGEDASHPEDEE